MGIAFFCTTTTTTTTTTIIIITGTPPQERPSLHWRFLITDWLGLQGQSIELARFIYPVRDASSDRPRFLFNVFLSRQTSSLPSPLAIIHVSIQYQPTLFGLITEDRENCTKLLESVIGEDSPFGWGLSRIQKPIYLLSLECTLQLPVSTARLQIRPHHLRLLFRRATPIQTGQSRNPGFAGLICRLLDLIDI